LILTLQHFQSNDLLHPKRGLPFGKKKKLKYELSPQDARRVTKKNGVSIFENDKNPNFNDFIIKNQKMGLRMLGESPCILHSVICAIILSDGGMSLNLFIYN